MCATNCFTEEPLTLVLGIQSDTATEAVGAGSISFTTGAAVHCLVERCVGSAVKTVYRADFIQ